jgi:hypothetical protein
LSFVFFAPRPEFLNVMYINLKVIDPAMAQAINGRPLIAVTWV